MPVLLSQRDNFIFLARRVTGFTEYGLLQISSMCLSELHAFCNCLGEMEFEDTCMMCSKTRIGVKSLPKRNCFDGQTLRAIFIFRQPNPKFTLCAPWSILIDKGRIHSIDGSQNAFNFICLPISFIAGLWCQKCSTESDADSWNGRDRIFPSCHMPKQDIRWPRWFMGTNEYMVQVTAKDYHDTRRLSNHWGTLRSIRQLPLLLEEQGRRVINSSMAITQITSKSDLENFSTDNCIFLAEISQPDGCYAWVDFLISLKSVFRTMVLGDFLFSPQASQNIGSCLAKLTDSGLYVLESNLTIASTENMEAKVLNVLVTILFALIWSTHAHARVRQMIMLVLRGRDKVQAMQVPIPETRAAPSKDLVEEDRASICGAECLVLPPSAR